MRRYRAWLIRLEAAAATRGSAGVTQLEVAVQSQALALLRSPAMHDAQRAIIEGRLTIAQLDATVSNMAGWRALQRAAVESGDRLAQLAVSEIRSAQVEVLAMAQRVGVASTVLQFAPGMQPQVAGMLRRISVEQVQNLVALGDKSSPLRALKSMGSASSMKVLDGMVKGVAHGDSPITVARRVASDVRDATRADVLRVCRSEMLRTSRSVTSEWMRTNSDVVTEWVWYAELDDATCAACWASHGEVFDTEQDPEMHPSDRCTMLPRPLSPDELGFTGIPDDRPQIATGIDQFEQLPAEQQRRILGPLKYQAFADGRIGLKDVVRRRHSEEWGTTRGVGSLEHALKQAA